MNWYWWPLIISTAIVSGWMLIGILTSIFFFGFLKKTDFTCTRHGFGGWPIHWILFILFLIWVAWPFWFYRWWESSRPGSTWYEDPAFIKWWKKRSYNPDKPEPSWESLVKPGSTDWVKKHPPN